MGATDKQRFTVIQNHVAVVVPERRTRVVESSGWVVSAPDCGRADLKDSSSTKNVTFLRHLYSQYYQPNTNKYKDYNLSSYTPSSPCLVMVFPCQKDVLK